MIETYALLISQIMAFIGGFLIGVGLKTILDGFARRDDTDRRLEAIEIRLEDAEDWIDAIESGPEIEVDSPGEMLEHPGELPPFGDYHRFASPPTHNE